MKQKTAMMELIDDLLTGKITDVLANQDRYLEKEKQQIVDAAETQTEKSEITGLDYYNQTYNQ